MKNLHPHILLKYILPFFFSVGVLCLSAQAPKVNIFSKVDTEVMNAWADSIFDSMTIDERIGQLFMVVADPTNNDANAQKIKGYISDVHIGGILFSKGAVTEQAKLTNRCQELSKHPLLISLDGEWGLSMRLEPTTRFPRNMMLGAIQDNDLLTEYGKEVGRQCREMGIHINFAPVMDVNVAPENPVIGMRSFGSDVANVTAKGIAYAKGLEAAGVLSVAKHFPGHGDTNDDSHHTLPVIPHDRQRLNQVELAPFVSYINAGLSGIMSGHLSVPALDPQSNSPSSLSHRIVTELLQKELGFQGICFTDALVMKGAGDSDICVESLKAGNDVLLSPANPKKEFESVKRAVNSGYIPLSLIEEKCRKILQLKYALGLHNYQPIAIRGLEARLNTPHAEFLATKLNAQAITLLKNEHESLPLKKLDNLSTASLALSDASPASFQTSMKRYLDMPLFSIAPNADATRVAEVCRRLKGYDRIILSIHSLRSRIPAELASLLSTKRVVLVYFVSPYTIGRFAEIEKQAESVVMAYENISYAQDCAGQLVFGGIGASGRLPVELPNHKPGAGLQTKKSRLAYQLPEAAGMSAAKLEKIDSIVEEGLSEKAFPGCQVLVAYKGVVVYNKAFGAFEYDGVRAVTTEDLYDIASVTKVTATVPALMMLYDNEKIKLNDSLAATLPQFAGTEIGGTSIRDLLFHQTGLPAFIPFYRMAINERSYEGNLFSNKPSDTHRVQLEKNFYARTDFKFHPHLCSPTASDRFNLRVSESIYISPLFKDSVFTKIADTPLGTKTYRYSDLNFILLGEVASAIAKQPLDKFLTERLYRPLGASRLGFCPLTRFSADSIAPTEKDDFLRKQLLVGYVDDEAAAFLGGVAGNAGLFSDANDMAKLAQMLLNDGVYGGERFISKETCRLFTQTKSPASRRGLGFDKPDMLDTKKSPVPGGLSGAVFGHTGFTGTCMWIDPDKQLIYIFLSNRVHPTRNNSKLSELNIRGRVHQAIYSTIER